MLNMEERTIVNIYSGSRGEVINKLRAIVPHIPSSGIAVVTQRAIAELEAMSDDDFAEISPRKKET